MIIQVLLSLFLFHDIHISRSEINYNSQSQTYEVAIMLFSDDLETWARLNGIKEDLEIGTEYESSNADEFVEKFLNQNFILTMDEEVVPLNFLGKEVTNDFYGIWVYLESTQTNLKGKISLENKVLLDLFDDQQNMTSFKRDGKNEKYFIFSGKKEKVTLFSSNE